MLLFWLDPQQVSIVNVYRYHVHTLLFSLIFLHIFNHYVLLYVYTASRNGGCVDRELNEQVMIERVEMIARLTTEGVCQERDREIALGLIAEIAKGNLMRNNTVTIFFTEKITNIK